jgi:hypothetical protein
MRQFNAGKIKLINVGIAEFLGWRHFDKAISVSYVDFYGDEVSVFDDVWTEGEDLIEGKYTYHYDKKGSINYHYSLKFHESWDALMPVIQKIAKLHYKSFPIVVNLVGDGGVHIAINHSNCAGEDFQGDRLIADTMNINSFCNDETMLYSEIELAWLAVAQFMEYKKKNNEYIH